MKIQNLKKSVAIIAAFSVLTAFGACNRGVGCPSNFSAKAVVAEVAADVAADFAEAMKP